MMFRAGVDSFMVIYFLPTVMSNKSRVLVMAAFRCA